MSRDSLPLSVCIIAQDRAGELDGLLANVADIAGEIIVVDGGSSDETPELARAAGATVIDRPWDGDWGAAKNAAFDAATNDWILNLDSDERIDDRLKSSLPKLITRPSAPFYRLPMVWVRAMDPMLRISSLAHDSLYLPRLFKNTQAHRYVADGPLHPTFSHEVVETMKKVNKGSILHLLFYFYSRREIEDRIKDYQAADPESRSTNVKYYPYWDISHRLRFCKNRITPPEGHLPPWWKDEIAGSA